MKNTFAVKSLCMLIALTFVLSPYILFIDADGTPADEQIFKNETNDKIDLWIEVTDPDKGRIWQEDFSRSSQFIHITFQGASEIWCKCGHDENGDFITVRKVDSKTDKFYLIPQKGEGQTESDYVFSCCGYLGTIIEDQEFMIKCTDPEIHIDVIFKDKNTAGNFAELQGLIDNNSEITLTKDYVCEGTEPALTISKSITINLAGFTIDRSLTSQKDDGYVMKITGNKITVFILDVTAEEGEYGYGKITGGYNSGNGGGIVVSDGAFLMLKGGSIVNNVSNGYGGGIYVDGASMETNYETSLSYNFAKNGGSGISLDDATLVMIDGSMVYNGDGNSPGGGIFATNESKINIANGSIILNKGTSGGGIYVDNASSADNPNLLALTGGYVCDNVATNNGGGIYVGTNNQFNMEKGTVSNNFTTTTGENIGGGGIYTEGKTTIRGGIITTNGSCGTGGGIYFFGGELSLDGTLADVGCSITKNYAQNGSGGISFNESATSSNTLSISGFVTITENQNGTYESEKWTNLVEANVKAYSFAKLGNKLSENSRIQIDDVLDATVKIILSNVPEETEKCFTTTADPMTGHKNGVVWFEGNLYLAPVCGENVYWMIENEVLTIAGENGVMDDYGETNDVAPWAGQSIKSVVISGTKAIGTYAFKGHTEIDNVYFEEGLETVGASAFEDCTGLKSLLFPGTEKLTLGIAAFKGCCNIAEITFEMQMDKSCFSDSSLSLGTQENPARVVVKTNGWDPEKVLDEEITGEYTEIINGNKEPKENDNFILYAIVLTLAVVLIASAAVAFFLKSRK